MHQKVQTHLPRHSINNTIYSGTIHAYQLSTFTLNGWQLPAYSAWGITVMDLIGEFQMVIESVAKDFRRNLS